MKQTDNFFLIHNYNTVPTELLERCNDYLIMDASDDENVRNQLDALELHVQHITNTGHNITSYFTWIADRLEEGNLPEVVALCKGNMIGRHCSAEYFDRVYDNKWFTYLYEERDMRDRYSKATKETLDRNNGKDPSEGSIARLVTESHYLEDNNSWYMQEDSHPKRYFARYDDLLRFIYRDPIIPKEVMFAPGACYIVRQEQLQLHRPAFYRNLNKLQNYTIEPAFPAEAYIIERILPIIWEEQYEVNPWMEDETAFDRKLLEAEGVLQKEMTQPRGRLQRLKHILLSK